MKTRILLTLLILMMLPLVCVADPVYTLNEQWVECGDGIKLLDPYYSPGITVKWDGPSKNGKANGHGTATTYKDGEVISTYVGDYKDGVREGKGTVTIKGGTVKSGTFINGQLTGKGTMEMENGNSYEGEFVNYRLHGNGKLKMGNGATFEGFFVSDEPYTGKYTHYDGSVVYIQAGEPAESLKKEKGSNYKPKLGTKVTEYFDKDWLHTDNKKASFYRIVTYRAPHVPTGVVRDYYMNGAPQGEASFAYIDYQDEGKNFKEGLYKQFFPNGITEIEGNYLNNLLNGPWKINYETGNPREERMYENGSPLGAVTYYPSGAIESLRMYENGVLKDNTYYHFDETGAAIFIIYEENFAQHSNHWEYLGPNGKIETVTDNSLVFSVTPYRQLSQNMYAPFTSDSNGIINLSVQREANSRGVTLGALLGFKDWGNFSGFFINGNKCSYKELVNGKAIVETEWNYSPAIHETFNNITLANLDGRLTIAVNGEEIGSVESPDFPGNYFVFTVLNERDEEANVMLSQLTLCEIVPNSEMENPYIPDIDNALVMDDWRGNGSGFFIDERGLIATNYHVVGDANAIEVTFTRDGVQESYPAHVVLSSKSDDLSIIQIDSPTFKPMASIPYNFPMKLQDTGTEVFAMGYPLLHDMGDEVKFTDGKISAKSGYRGDKKTYQISAPIQNGNSGGPLFDKKGNIIGIVSSGLESRTYHPQNVNYAIKLSYLKNLVDQLPSPIDLQMKADNSSLDLVEMIKAYEPYVTLIKIK